MLALVAALVLSLLSVLAPVAANAEDGAARSISGVVSLPEGADAALLADVRVSATAANDASADAAAAATPAADGSYALEGLAAEAYNVSFEVTGAAAEALEGQAFGVTEEFPDGQVVDLAASDRVDVNAALEIVVAVASVEADAVVPAEEAPAAEAIADEATESEVVDEVQDRLEALSASEEADAQLTEALAGADVTDANQVGAIDAEAAGVADGEPVVAAAPVDEGDAVYVAAASGTRTISGKVSMPAGYESWLSSARVFLFDSKGSNSKTVKVNASTGVWSASVVPGQYKVEFYLASSTQIVTRNWFPNQASVTTAKYIDVRSNNASKVNASMKLGVDLSGKVSLPSGFDVTRTELYALNSRGQAIAVTYPRSNGSYSFYALPAGDLWFLASTDNASYKLQGVQFLKTGGKTKHTPAAGKVSTRNLAGTTAKSTINGTINVTGGLPKDFMRAANIYQKVDGIWFPMYYSWQNFPAYKGIALAKGDYAVEFTAKTGRDVAKGEWYNKKSSRAKANIIKLTGSNKATGINGTLSSGSSGQVSPFVDVKTNHKFYNEIAWMFYSGTSTGVRKGGKAYYQPKNGVSREAMAAFMYRMNAPANYKAPKKSPFKDVSTKHKFYKEISWMYTSGLSTGVRSSSGRNYMPKDRVSREAMAAFMFRQYAKPSYKAYGSSFNDVNKKHKFYKEIQWMNDTGLSTGVRSRYGKAYQPKNTVTREAMAAFLFRNALNN